MAGPTPLTPQDRAAIAAAVLRHCRKGGEAAWTQGQYREAEAYDLSGIILHETARMNGSAGAQDAVLIAYARIGLGLKVETPARDERALVGFNDLLSRTFADVLALCERVAHSLDAEATD